MYRLTAEENCTILIEGHKPNREGWKISRFRKGEYLNFIVDNILKPLEQDKVDKQNKKATEEIETKQEMFGVIDF